MKLCAIQVPYPYTLEQADAAVDFAIRELERCDSSCDLILTPEYTNAPTVFPKGACIPYAKAHTPALIRTASETARRCNAIVAVNYACEVMPGVFRNTTRVFDRAGKVAGEFYKQHLPRSERQVKMMDDSYTLRFRRPEIVEVDGLRIGFLVCYDTYFSEYIAHLAYCRPDIVLVSSHQRAERPDIIRMQNQHLAFSCNSFVLRASVSMGPDAAAGGCSLAAAPDGRILGEFGNATGMFSCEIEDPHYKYRRSNCFQGALILNDRFVEQGRTPWSYRPCGSMVIEPEEQLPYPRVCAHRGFKTVAPENTLPAFGAAIALGAPEIELDVRFSRDGVPVVSHDDDLRRIVGRGGMIGELTLKELKQFDCGGKFSPHFAGLRMAAFEEVLAKFARQVIINLHIKSVEGEPFSRKEFRTLVELLERYDCLQHVYLVGGVEVMRCALETAPDIPRCMGASPDHWKIVERAIQYRCRKMQIFTPDYNREMIDKAHDNGIRCNFFYCDDPKEAEKLWALGIDTILTNDYLAIANTLSGNAE